MMNIPKPITLLSAALILVGFVGVTNANADTIYNSIPNPLPGNVPSLGYEATQTKEFGNLISFAAGSRNLTQVTAVMSNWALESTYETLGTSSGFNIPLTLTLYNVGAGNSVGSVFASETITALAPWRPEATAGCGNGGWGGACLSGLAFTVSFNFAGVVVPDSLIYGLAFNTQTAGYAPTGLPGPYNSFNFGLAVVAPTVGSNPLPDSAYWNTAHASFYADGGAAGVGTFRQDATWSPYSGAIEFNVATAVPEPETYAMMLAGLGLLGFITRRRERKAA